mmetsp:Transcript_6381/g.9031  ORF Transcript_6381/g.9031 Transcript_6381/m.9031 type:complete len:90 (-) Transcript_6381:52-321(-)
MHPGQKSNSSSSGGTVRDWTGIVGKEDENANGDELGVKSSLAATVALEISSIGLIKNSLVILVWFTNNKTATNKTPLNFVCLLEKLTAS